MAEVRYFMYTVTQLVFLLPSFMRLSRPRMRLKPQLNCD